MASEWYYTRNGQRHGPVSGHELKRLAATGGLLPTDLIWKDGLPKWRPASATKGLFPARPQTVVVPPPLPSDAVPTTGGTRSRSRLRTVGVVACCMLLGSCLLCGVVGSLLSPLGALATHETSDATVLFVGKANDQPGSSATFSYIQELSTQTILASELRRQQPEWFKPNGARPKDVRLLQAGTRLRSLKVANISSNHYDPIHFAEVVDGPERGVRGWIADKELNLAH